MLPIVVRTLASHLWLLMLFAIVGCNDPHSASPDDHDHEHELPAHWPESLADAADKLQYRLELLTGNANAEPATEKELSELVEWVPEIAADSELSEADWLPIFEASETIRHHLAAGDISIHEIGDDVERLAEVLRQAHAQLMESQTHILDNNED